ncbi:fasciclin [Sporanaerobium hydrogeniformans]|uniref:Fasciclin n=1 Tax=Sporanaerobium hydrogeniformans TaxID=3072179 RepID=A0AC61DB50_9FIRM|nr:fasciclin domain-containing protein [Sporanaerobium hydrogeniformans]PHV70484.1 fasciclin [Sporanaerobium hydrogeniformans]
MKKKYSIKIVLTLVLMLALGQSSLLAHHVRSVSTTTNQKQMSDKDIVTIASSDGRFTTLVAALKAAGLVDTLKGPGPFTVFAPTDEAFAKLPAGTVEELLKPENRGTLVNILTYHVIPGKITSKEATNLVGKEVEMLNKGKAKIEMKDGSLYIDGAKIIMTDIMGKNGVIHVIDTVMMP